MNHYTLKKFRETLQILSISDYQGLKSPGLTCYLNSVLQVLFMTEEFRETVKRKFYANPRTFDFHLRELFCALERNMAQTHNITEKLGIKDVYEQRDAAEYFEKILSRASPEASKIFKGELNHITTCLKCNDLNQSNNFFWVLPLPMGDSKFRSYSVLQGWESFFRDQRVCGENQMFCSVCKQKQDAKIVSAVSFTLFFVCFHFVAVSSTCGCFDHTTQEYKMSHCPDVLTLLLKRFSFDYMLNCYVKLQCEADLAQTLETKNCRYDLYAIVHHFGDLMGGHYTAEIKSFETGNWYRFNDDTVRKIYITSAKNPIKSKTAYLLMYKLVSRRAMKAEESARKPCWIPSDETEDGCNETEPREDLISEYLLKKESCEGVRRFNGAIITDAEFKDQCSSSFRPDSEKSNQRAAMRMLQGSMWPPADNDNTRNLSDIRFNQSFISLVKGINESRTEQGNHKTNTLYNHSPPRKRMEASGTMYVFNHNERLTVEAKQRNGRTVTEETYRNNLDKYNANSHCVYLSSSSLARSSQSFRAASESNDSPTSKRSSDKLRTGSTERSSSLKISNSEKMSMARKIT